MCDNDSLHWSVWPLIERKGKTAIMLFITSSFAFVSFVFTKSYFVLFAVVVALLFELQRFILPTKVKISDEAISLETPLWTKTSGWTKYKRALVDRNGILLTPYVHKSILEKFKGMYILTGKNTSQEAKDFILNKYK